MATLIGLFLLAATLMGPFVVRPAAPAPPPPTSPPVTLLALPNSGVQPQAVTDPQGTLHVVYFKGEAMGGDLFYIRRAPGAVGFSRPARVNSVTGSAMATGVVRGVQLAVGRNGRVHVAWNGAAPIESDGVRRVPMFYARLDDAGAGFEPQRDLLTWTKELDGGGAIAADRLGRVFVTWHAAGKTPGEDHRAVYVTTSINDGRTFSRETQATTAPIGACGCCGMRALIDKAGSLQVMYRAATQKVHRDTTWLTLPRTGAAPPPVTVHPWKLEACPMSTFAMAETRDGILAAWQTEEQVYSAVLDPKTRTISTPVAATGTGPTRGHPSLAVNAAGDRLLAWTEGTGWARGGTLAWETTDRRGRVLASRRDAGRVPVWGLVAAVALADGSFAIVH